MRLALIAALLLAGCATTPKPLSGDYGLICIHHSTGDYRGYRMTIDTAAPSVTLAFCDGECARYATSKVAFDGKTLTFEADSKASRRDKMSLPQHLTFTGTFEKRGLILSADGDAYDIEPELVRRKSKEKCLPEWGEARPLSLEPFSPD